VFGHYIYHVLNFTCKIVRLTHSFIKGYILYLTWLDLCINSSSGLYPATPYGWELPLSWNKFSPSWRRTTNSLFRGSTCFDNQLTRPLHANLLLPYLTEGIHTKTRKPSWRCQTRAT